MDYSSRHQNVIYEQDQSKLIGPKQDALLQGSIIPEVFFSSKCHDDYKISLCTRVISVKGRRRFEDGVENLN